MNLIRLMEICASLQASRSNRVSSSYDHVYIWYAAPGDKMV